MKKFINNQILSLVIGILVVLNQANLYNSEESKSSTKNFPTDDVSDIKEFHSGNYIKNFKTHQHIFIFYYSPYCKYSISLASEYVKVSTFFYNFDYSKGVVLAKFNVNQDKETAEELKVEGTPVFRYYFKGKLVEEYSGQRTSIGLFNFILHSLKIYSTELIGESQLNAFTQFSKNSLVFIGQEANLPSFKDYIKNITDEVMIGHVITSNTHNKSIAVKFESDDNADKAVLFIDGNKKAVFNPEHGNFSTIKDFVSFNLYDYILNFTEETAKYIFSQGKPGLFFYVAPKDYAFYSNFISNELPKNIRERILIYLLGNEEYENVEGRLYSVVGVSPKDFPSVKIHQRIDNLKTTTMTGDITVENVSDFVNNWLNNGFPLEYKDDL